MAVSYYLYLNGITGQSQANFKPVSGTLPKGIMEVTSFTFEADNSTALGTTSTGSGAGKVTFQPLTITKPVDSATPQLFTSVATGKHLTTGSLYVVRTGNGTATLTYLEYDLTTIIVTDDLVSGTADGETPTETVKLEFAKVVITYVPQNPDGTGGTPVIGAFDQLTNSPT